MAEQAWEPGVRNGAIGTRAPDRRVGYDRRRLSWRTFVQGSLTPRRRGVRRDTEGRHDFVDWHEPQLLFLAVTILLLSVADAFLTLTLITHGAYEANPLLAVLLDAHPRYFAGAKMALTGGGVVILVVLARARVFGMIRVGALMHACLLGYVSLIAYEWWLLGQTL